MKTLSLKLDEAVFATTEAILKKLQKPRNRYINEAIDHYNQYQKRLLLSEKLKEESALVQEDSMSVLKEFEGLEENGLAI
ncbi:MAG: hypothetical protein WD077_11565 [Bacteroidia bacterium]